MTPHLDVVWFSARPETPARGFWDQAVVEDLLAGRFGPMPTVVEHDHPSTVSGGGVVIVPARHHVEETGAISDAIAHLDWVVLVLTGDEEGVLDHHHIHHPRARRWVQPGIPDRGDDDCRRIGWGYAPWVPELLRDHGPDERRVDVAFAGQVTHERRYACVEALVGLDCVTEVHPSPGFTQGLGPSDYVDLLARSRIVACPSGPVHPDTFRIYETLEAGAVPIVDALAPGFAHGWWVGWTYGEVPFPVITDWAEVGSVVEAVLADWDRIAARCQAWWVQQCRRMRLDLLTDVRELSS